MKFSNSIVPSQYGSADNDSIDSSSSVFVVVVKIVKWFIWVVFSNSTSDICSRIKVVFTVIKLIFAIILVVIFSQGDICLLTILFAK